MLDWRGVVGTTLFHGLAVAASPYADVFQPTTTCLCWSFGPEYIRTFAVARNDRLTLFGPPSSVEGDLFQIGATCGGAPALASLPAFVEAPMVTEALARGSPLVVCVSVDSGGRVTALRVVQAGGRSRAALTRLRKRMEAIRLAPATLNGRPVATEVEMRLTA